MMLTTICLLATTALACGKKEGYRCLEWGFNNTSKGEVAFARSPGGGLQTPLGPFKDLESFQDGFKKSGEKVKLNGWSMQEAYYHLSKKSGGRPNERPYASQPLCTSWMTLSRSSVEEFSSLGLIFTSRCTQKDSNKHECVIREGRYEAYEKELDIRRRTRPRLKEANDIERYFYNIVSVKVTAIRFTDNDQGNDFDMAVIEFTDNKGNTAKTALSKAGCAVSQRNIQDGWTQDWNQKGATVTVPKIKNKEEIHLGLKEFTKTLRKLIDDVTVARPLSMTQAEYHREYYQCHLAYCDCEYTDGTTRRGYSTEAKRIRTERSKERWNMAKLGRTLEADDSARQDQRGKYERLRAAMDWGPNPTDYRRRRK
jgi:hypothetical protein